MTITRTVALLVCSFSLASLGSMPACKHMGGASKAMELLPENIKQAAQGYLGQFGDLNKMLGSIKTPVQASEARPKLQQTVNTLNGHSDQLNSASPDVKKNIESAYGKQFSSLSKTFESHKNKLLSNSQISNILKPVLDKVKLFG